MSFNFLDIFLVLPLNYCILPWLGSLETIPHGCSHPPFRAQRAVTSVAVKTARLSAGLESVLNLITLCFFRSNGCHRHHHGQNGRRGQAALYPVPAVSDRSATRTQDFS